MLEVRGLSKSFAGYRAVSDVDLAVAEGEIAAVIGKDFPLALLLAVAGEKVGTVRRRLDHLQTAEFLFETRLLPDLEYAFKHALTHEVAYGSLFPGRRRDLHVRIAETMERLYGDRLGEQIERLAHHAVRGEVWEKAVPYLRRAALKAAARSALREAQVWFDQALDGLAALPPSPSTLEQGFEIRLELGPVLVQLGEARRRLEHAREAEILAERLNDDRRRARAHLALCNAHALLGEPDEALAAGTRALEMAGRLGDLRLRILAPTRFPVHVAEGRHRRRPGAQWPEVVKRRAGISVAPLRRIDAAEPEIAEREFWIHFQREPDRSQRFFVSAVVVQDVRSIDIDRH